MVVLGVGSPTMAVSGEWEKTGGVTAVIVMVAAAAKVESYQCISVSVMHVVGAH